MARGRCPTRAPLTQAARARWVVVALALALPDAAGARTGEGEVIFAAARPIAVQTRGGVELVDLAPAASLVGLGDVRELRAGDRVRYSWSREQAGVKLAETLAADPVVASDPSLAIADDALALAVGQEPPPVLLDARDRRAWEAGHLPGARHVDRERLAQTLPGDPDAALVVYGASRRTGEAHALARELLARGRRNVRVLSGGVQEWVLHDRPLELAPAALASALGGGSSWIVADVRPEGEAAAGRIPGALVVPDGVFHAEELDGRAPLRPLVLVGADERDPAPALRAEAIRRFRSGAEIRAPLQLFVLAGGVAAWRRAGLPVEAGAEPARAAPFRPLVAGEIDPAEFERRWSERGATVTYLDVRRSSPPQGGVLQIPLEQLAARLGELPRDREVIVFCAVGQRSRAAYELLRKNGVPARFLRASAGR